MQEEIERNESCIRDVLSYNRIEIRDIKVLVGPAVSLYKVYLVLTALALRFQTVSETMFR